MKKNIYVDILYEIFLFFLSNNEQSKIPGCDRLSPLLSWAPQACQCGMAGGGRQTQPSLSSVSTQPTSKGYPIVLGGAFCSEEDRNSQFL